MHRYETLQSVQWPWLMSALLLLCIAGCESRDVVEAGTGSEVAFAKESVLDVGGDLTLRDEQVPTEAKDEPQAEASAAPDLAGAQNDFQKYIAKLKAEDGWKQTPSGITYRVLTEGAGPSPDDNDIALMNYMGTFLDGREFDSSYARGQPVKLSAESVIQGWAEIMKMMRPGDVYEVVIPYELAYGKSGVPPRIPPFTPLKFNMQMHSFEIVPNP